MAHADPCRNTIEAEKSSIEAFIQGLDLDDRRADDKTKAAVERKPQSLTEAIIRLENDAANQFPEIDYKGYRGMGDLIRHSYHRVDDAIGWETLKSDLPGLREIVGRYLQGLN